ncbi:MAG: hypothetical protein M1503_00850 [Thaumarchaeota archaeon]|nr:hypothetical protein [Nitrososphaerota archaeon]MCL5316802.1 hypothetical protein [Nitrososphaerota archaeon]
MSRRVHIAAFGSGLGHAARMSPVARILKQEGVNVRFSSFSHAVDYLRKQGFDCDEVAPVDIEWRNEGVSVRDTFNNSPALITNLFRQIAKERQILRRFQPNLVLSDTRLSAVIAAALEGVPSITVANQLRIHLPPRYHTARLRPIEGLSAEMLGLFWSRSRLILIPDIPPPYTICEENTSPIRILKKQLRYVGFMTPTAKLAPDKLHKVIDMLNLHDSGKPIVFANISGPPETKRGAIDASIKAANLLKNHFTVIVSRGDVGGAEEPRRISGGWLYEWCPVKDELFWLADLLIVRGGHSTIGQAIISSKPMVSVPINNHSEQYVNASKVDKLGLGRMIPTPDLSAERLAEAVEEVGSNPAFKERVEKVGAVARKMDGIKNAVEIVNSLL